MGKADVIVQVGALSGSRQHLPFIRGDDCSCDLIKMHRMLVPPRPTLPLLCWASLSLEPHYVHLVNCLRALYHT